MTFVLKTAHILAAMRFRVPGTTTNLGHGFDCFGIALSTANIVSVEQDKTCDNEALAQMLEKVQRSCAKAWQCDLPSIAMSIEGDVPIARGMGSSSTIYAAATAAYQLIHNEEMDLGEIIRLGDKLEGHPDNICAAVLGGFTIVAQVAGRLQWQRFDMPEQLEAVISIPNFEVKTDEARQVLPQQFTKAEGITAIQRCSMISAALAGKRLNLLRGLFDDAWHEQYRAELNPGLVTCREAADQAGAIGTFLSGSGSCILSLCTKSKVSDVHAALEAAYGDTAEIRQVTFNNSGIELI